MQNVDSIQLNEYVRDILRDYHCGTYRLSEIGQKKVIAANAELDEKYAHLHNLPVADWCFQDMREKLEQMPPERFGTVLDVCTGTGFVSLNIMRKKMFERCVALDINPEAVKLLKVRADQMNIRGVEAQIGNIMDTRFESNSFDCVMGNSFLHHLPDNETFLREMYRILKPGGVVCFMGEPSVSAIKYQNLFQRLILRMVGKKHGPKGEVPLTDIWQFERQAVQTLLSNVGFREVKISGHGKWSTAFGSFIERVWMRLSGNAAPSVVGWMSSQLARMGQRLMPEKDSNKLAIVVISARK